jgi:hypothetical protein
VIERRCVAADEIGNPATTHLSVVTRKVQVVESVMRRTVDVVFQHVSANHVPVVNQNRPELYQDEEDKVEVFVERENKDEDAETVSSSGDTGTNLNSLVWKGLRIAVDGVERKGGKRCGNCRVSSFPLSRSPPVCEHAAPRCELGR